MLFYRSALPLSRRTLNLAARTIRTHRKNAGSRWCRLDPAQRALLVLVHLYKGEPFTHLATGFGGGTTAAWPRFFSGGNVLRNGWVRPGLSSRGGCGAFAQWR